MGSATITEILNAARPADYPIWNQQVRKALEKLGIPGLSKLSNINGSQYKEIINMLKPFIEVIKDKNNLPNPDYLDLNYFFYHVATGVDTNKVDIGQEHELDHEETVELLMQVGSGLGFEVM
ncbi:MAG: hypothetical protein N3H84_05040 [Candidatus Caldarchaeum sp.]|nr:hypothetical protein [Candidatus Caldarchaeum sp.]